MIRVDESTVLVCTPALLLVAHAPYPSPPVVGARGQERAA